MFDLILNPFVTVLTLFYSLFGDIVIAIAVFTALIRLGTSPLLITQQRSMKAQQELQPELRRLQEKYKNDREKLAAEQMELYKKHGVNPLSGCLPLFVQLPILLAMYQAIIHALAASPYQLIDLSDRLWLPGLDQLVPLQNIWLGMDLTLAPTLNPVYALSLPLLVMVTTWLQQKLTIPQPVVDPNDDSPTAQAANVTKTMTTIMPLMFGFFSLSFSVGLSIYFVVSNVVGIAQYTLMGRAEWGRLLGRAPAKAEANLLVEKGKSKQPVPSGAKAAPVTVTPNTTSGAAAPARPKPKSKKDKKMRPREALKAKN